MAEKLYTTRQAAAAAGVSHQTLYTWIDEGKIDPPAMIGATRIWTQSQVNKLKKIPRRPKR